MGQHSITYSFTKRKKSRVIPILVPSPHFMSRWFVNAFLWNKTWQSTFWYRFTRGNNHASHRDLNQITIGYGNQILRLVGKLPFLIYGYSCNCQLRSPNWKLLTFLKIPLKANSQSVTLPIIGYDCVGLSMEDLGSLESFHRHTAGIIPCFIVVMLGRSCQVKAQHQSSKVLLKANNRNKFKNSLPRWGQYFI